MDPATPPITPHVPVYHASCPRRLGRSLLPLRDIEEGVKRIQEILEKNLLCAHDVDQINEIYRQINLLERQVDVIPKCNSQHVLQAIIEKVKVNVGNISLNPVKNVEGLVSLYYLQNFSDKNIPIKKNFDILWSKFKKTPQILEPLANCLPDCGLEMEFDQAFKSLIGPKPDEGISKILSRKKEKFQTIEREKLKLQELRESERKLQELKESKPRDFPIYPAYLDELLEGGYFHLYNHLIKMRALDKHIDRESAIKEMTFSLLSHVVIETRQAIIEKVENSFPANHGNILFLLGSTGAGKSTTFCFLRGDEMMLEGAHYVSKSDRDTIGHSLTTSCTLLPTVKVVNDWVLIDFPGFHDTNGPLVSLGIECALKALVKKYQPKILLIESITNIGGRCEIIAQLGKRLKRLLDDPKKCTLGITKYSMEHNSIGIRAIEEKQRSDELLKLTTEEDMLARDIQKLSAYNQDFLREMIEQKQSQLKEIQKQKAEQLQKPLPETEEKVSHRKKIEEIERELLKQIGMGEFIPLSNLEDFHSVSLCFKHLDHSAPVSVNSNHLLDSGHKGLIDHLFFSNLENKLKSLKDYDFDVAHFEKNVRKSSLIYALCSRSNPEIGTFFHLPEINLGLVRDYDKRIVEQCIQEYVNYLVCKLDIVTIDNALNEIEKIVGKAPVSELKAKFDELRKLIMDLKGVGREKQQQEDIKKAWQALRDKEIRLASQKVGWVIPDWVRPLVRTVSSVCLTAGAVGLGLGGVVAGAAVGGAAVMAGAAIGAGTAGAAVGGAAAMAGAAIGAGTAGATVMIGGAVEGAAVGGVVGGLVGGVVGGVVGEVVGVTAGAAKVIAGAEVAAGINTATEVATELAAGVVTTGAIIGGIIIGGVGVTAAAGVAGVVGAAVGGAALGETALKAVVAGGTAGIGVVEAGRTAGAVVVEEGMKAIDQLSEWGLQKIQGAEKDRQKYMETITSGLEGISTFHNILQKLLELKGLVSLHAPVVTDDT